MGKKSKVQPQGGGIRWTLTENNKMSFGGKHAYPMLALSIAAIIFKFLCVVIIVIAAFMTLITGNYIGMITVVMGVILFIASWQLGKTVKKANSLYLEKVAEEVRKRNVRS